MGENRSTDITNRLATCIEEDSTTEDCSIGANVTPVNIHDPPKNHHLNIMAIADSHSWAESSSDSTISIGLTAHHLDLSYSCSGTPYLKAFSPADYARPSSHNRTDGNKNSPYAFQGECPLSQHDCIRKSILYAKSVAKTTNTWTELTPVIASPSSSSSQVGYPDEEDSGNDGTYSIIEELPSDYNDENFRSSEDSILSDDDDNHQCQQNKIMKMYSDSLDDSRSSSCLRADKSHQRVYKYLRKCLTAEENIRHSLMRANEPVTGVQFHQNAMARETNDVSSTSIPYKKETNSYSAKASRDTQNESISYSLTSETSLNSTSPHDPKLECQTVNSGETELPLTLQVTENSDGAMSHTHQLIHSPNANDSADEIDLASIILEPPCDSANDADLTGIILEPPCMFRSDSKEKNTAAIAVVGNVATSVSSDESDWPVEKVYVADANIPAKIHPSFVQKGDVAASIHSDKCQFEATHSTLLENTDHCIEELIIAAEAIPKANNRESILQDTTQLLSIDEASLINTESSKAQNDLTTYRKNIANDEEQKCVSLTLVDEVAALGMSLSQEANLNKKEFDEIIVTKKSVKNTNSGENNMATLNHENTELVVNTTAELVVAGSPDANNMATENLISTKIQSSDRLSHQERTRGCDSSDEEEIKAGESAWTWSTHSPSIGTNLVMQQAVVKQGGLGNDASSGEGSVKGTIWAPDILYHLVTSFADTQCSLEIWKSLSSKNLNQYKWHLHQQDQKYQLRQWHLYQRNQQGPPHQLCYGHALPPRVVLLQDSDNSLLNLAVHDTLFRPSQRLRDISQAIVATCSSAWILQYDFATAILLAEPICFNLYPSTQLSPFFCNSKNDIEEGYRKNCHSKSVGDVIESLIKWHDDSKPIVQEGQWVDNYPKNITDSDCNDKIGCNNEVINSGGSDNASSADSITGVVENENCGTKVDVALCISNLEAIQKISDYFKKSLETGSKQAGISDLAFDIKLETHPVIKPFAMQGIIGPSNLKNTIDDNNNNQHDDDDENQNENNLAPNLTEDLNNTDMYKAGKSDTSVENEDDQDQVTSFIFSSWDSAFSDDEDSTGDVGVRKEDKKKNLSISTPVVEDIIVTIIENKTGQQPGILKSMLKRSSKKCLSKNRVQFDENLNEFIEADYVILIPDNEYLEEDNYEDVGYGWCECSNQPSYRSSYLVDFEVEENDDGFKADNHDHSSSVDSPTLDFTAAIDSPHKFFNSASLSPLDYQENSRCGSESASDNFSNKVSSSTMNHLDGSGSNTF